jgi:hypothetical protein
MRLAGLSQALRLGRSTRPGDSDKDSRAKPRSAADWNLRSDSFSRHRRTIRPSAAGTDAGNSAGSSFKIALITSTDELPVNARLPQSISYSTTPKLNRSER